ncbi:hypothetical protein [Streptomyces antibioticus]|uniref:hypothetical protein n=1 Tax=Streptomyces antibioticus TaxID=1890 RepID=UPI0033D83FBF
MRIRLQRQLPPGTMPNSIHNGSQTTNTIVPAAGRAMCHEDNHPRAYRRETGTDTGRQRNRRVRIQKEWA